MTRYTTSTPLDARKQPPIEARRRHIFGPLQGLDSKTPVLVWVNLFSGVAVMVGLGIIGTLLCAAIGG